MHDLGELLAMFLAFGLIYLVAFTEIPLKLVRNAEHALDAAYIGGGY